ncbi:MAG: amino acid ABC transporter permease [Victivallales bacterium]|nr:amino acid ABC transporter permease [Victivallales bacterium]
MNYGLMFKELMIGLDWSVIIFALTLVFALPLGLLVALVRMSKLATLNWLARIYISVLRGTPLMLQLLVIYFGPYYIFRIGLSSHYRLFAVIIAFSINYSAYFAEIFRAGIEAIPVGQYEASYVLGLTRWQNFSRIIMPQVIKRILPPVTNEVITLVKDTSLAFSISMAEMFTRARELASGSASMMPFIAAGIIYYFFNFLVALGMERVEKRLSYYSE